MTLRRRIFAGAAWSAVETWCRQGLMFVTFAIMARYVSPEDYGLMALAVAFTSIAEAVITTALPEAIVQRQAIEDDHPVTAFWILLAAGAVIAVGTAVAAVPLSAVLGQPRLTPVLQVLSVLALLQALAAIPTALLRRQLEFRLLAMRSMAGSLVGGLVGVLLALKGHGIWALVGAALGRATVEVVMLWSFTRWRPSFRFSKRHYLDLHNFASWSLALKVVGTLVLQLPTVLIGSLLGPVALGYYSVANKLLEFLTQIIILPINSIGMPVIARLQSEPHRVEGFVNGTTQSLALIAFPAFCGLASVAKEAVPFLFGSEWIPSVPVLQALALVGVIQSLNILFGSVLQGTGHQYALFVLATLRAIPRVLVVVALAPFGITVVAIGMVVELYVFTPVDIWAIRRVTGIDLSQTVRRVAPVLAACMIMALTVLLWDAYVGAAMSTGIALATSILVGAAIYVGAMVIFAPGLVRQGTDLLRSVASTRQW